MAIPYSRLVPIVHAECAAGCTDLALTRLSTTWSPITRRASRSTKPRPKKHQPALRSAWRLHPRASQMPSAKRSRVNALRPIARWRMPFATSCAVDSWSDFMITSCPVAGGSAMPSFC